MTDQNSERAARSRPAKRPGWALIQDVQPRHKGPTVAHTQPETIAAPTKPVTTKPLAHTSHLSKNDTPTKNWLHRNILIVIAPFVSIASILLSTQPLIGEGIIALYGIVAIVRRFPSRISFWLATMVLTGVGAEFLFLSGIGKVSNGALFAFLLLVVGLGSSMLETRRLVAKERALRRR